MDLRRGEIYYVDLSPAIGSEQGGMRPVLILQNDIGNRFSPTTIVAAISTKFKKAKLPTHVELDETYGLREKSIILAEQIRTIDKSRLGMARIGQLDEYTMKSVENAIMASLGINFSQESRQVTMC